MTFTDLSSTISLYIANKACCSGRVLLNKLRDLLEHDMAAYLKVFGFNEKNIPANPFSKIAYKEKKLQHQQ